MNGKLKRLKENNVLLLLPILLLMLLVYAYPFIRTFIFGFYNISFGEAQSNFIGVDNYIYLLRERVFWESIVNSVLWTFGNLFLQLVIPLVLAVLLNKKVRGINFIRSIIMLPWVVPTVTIAVSMRWMLLPRIGIIGELLSRISFSGKQIHLLGGSNTSMITLIILNSWKFLPFGTLMILASLQTIPDDIYEAARVDGTSGFQQFRYITLPILSSMIWFVGFLAFSWNFNTFDLIWLTTQGGPGSATQTLPVLIYRTAFKTFRLGEASAISVIIAVVLVVIGIFYFRLFSPKKDGFN